jgi:aspartate ammonia-lyase
MPTQYYGYQTELALENFPFPIHKVHKELIYTITEIKLAAALAHEETGELPSHICQSIAQAAKEVLAGKHDDQFVTSAMQGGAGTSINMNVNEVLASRASEVLREQGQDTSVHPNDHVNRSQSTNDVNPSALKILAYRETQKLISKLEQLIQELDHKAQEYKDIAKLGRTHIQDAVPTTLGAEMAAYAAVIGRDKTRFEHIFQFLSDLNLGGTAIGNGLNASKAYNEKVFTHLQKITQLEIRPAANKMSLTSGQADFAHLSSLITILAGDMSKIAKDLRFLASGPNGGIGEIQLESLQPGSSIMPGKVNPVIPEVIDQMFYFVAGKNITIQKAAEDSHLELGIMFPVLADSLITSLKVVQTGIEIFASKCIHTLQANPQKCRQHLENSTAYATLLTPILGYDKVSEIVKTAVSEQKTLREVILEKEIMSEQEFEEAIRLIPNNID